MYVLGYSSAYGRREDGGILCKHLALGLALLCTPSKGTSHCLVAFNRACAGTLLWHPGLLLFDAFYHGQV